MHLKAHLNIDLSLSFFLTHFLTKAFATKRWKLTDSWILVLSEKAPHSRWAVRLHFTRSPRKRLLHVKIASSGKKKWYLWPKTCDDTGVFTGNSGWLWGCGGFQLCTRLLLQQDIHLLKVTQKIGFIWVRKRPSRVNMRHSNCKE